MCAGALKRFVAGAFTPFVHMFVMLDLGRIPLSAWDFGKLLTLKLVNIIVLYIVKRYVPMAKASCGAVPRCSCNLGHASRAALCVCVGCRMTTPPAPAPVALRSAAAP